MKTAGCVLVLRASSHARRALHLYGKSVFVYGGTASARFVAQGRFSERTPPAGGPRAAMAGRISAGRSRSAMTRSRWRLRLKRR